MLTLPSAHNLPIAQGFLQASRNVNYGQLKAHTVMLLTPIPEGVCFGLFAFSKTKGQTSEGLSSAFPFTHIDCDKTGRKAAQTQPNNARPAFKQHRKAGEPLSHRQALRQTAPTADRRSERLLWGALGRNGCVCILTLLPEDYQLYSLPFWRQLFRSALQQAQWKAQGAIKQALLPLLTSALYPKAQ